MISIPLEQAVICWDDASRFPPRGRVGVMTFEDYGQAPSLGQQGMYRSSRGACNLPWRNATKPARLAMLHDLFLALTVCEGIDPGSANQAFCVIPEWRRSLASDIPGATYFDQEENERLYVPKVDAA